jgi:hypothetical protein
MRKVPPRTPPPPPATASRRQGSVRLLIPIAIRQPHGRQKAAALMFEIIVLVVGLVIFSAIGKLVIGYLGRREPPEATRPGEILGAAIAAPAQRPVGIFLYDRFFHPRNRVGEQPLNESVADLSANFRGKEEPYRACDMEYVNVQKLTSDGAIIDALGGAERVESQMAEAAALLCAVGPRAVRPHVDSVFYVRNTAGELTALRISSIGQQWHVYAERPGTSDRTPGTRIYRSRLGAPETIAAASPPKAMGQRASSRAESDAVPIKPPKSRKPKPPPPRPGPAIAAGEATEEVRAPRNLESVTRTLLRQFASGALSEAQLRALLTREGVPAPLIDSFVRSAQLIKDNPGLAGRI